MMPKHPWESRQLREVAKVTIGLVTTMTKHYVENGIPLIRNSDIKEKYVRTTKLIYLDPEFANMHSSRRLNSGDIVTVHTGDVGISAVITDKLHGALGFATLNTRINNRILDANFLCCFFNSSNFVNQCIAFSTGDGRQNLNLKDFAKFLVPIPPLPEQKKIAKILATWDEAIATTEQLIKKSKAKHKALLQRLYNKAAQDYGSTPVKLGEVMSESRIIGSDGKNAKKITIKLYGKGVIPKDEKRAGSESTTYYKRKAGQFIYSKLDFLNGAFGLIPKELDEFESTLDLPAFDLTDKVNPVWLINLVSRKSFYKSKLGLANGGRKARRVNPNDFLKIEITLPSMEEQNKIAQIITCFDSNISFLEEKLTALQQEKKALMQQLLTGKRRVKVDNAQSMAVAS